MQKKKISIIITLSLLLALFSSCNNDNKDTPSAQSDVSTVSEISEATSKTVSETSEPEEITEMLTNLTYTNIGDRTNGHLLGDLDGPAYCVYSKIGYNKASFDVDLGTMQLDLTRKSDNKSINAYMFIGCDIYDSTGSWWKNCIDSGLVNDGGNGWHIFYSLYSVDDTFTGNKWYESSKKLNSTHKYRLVLDASQEDGTATLSVIDLTDDEKTVDQVTFQLQYALKIGQNIRFYQDVALDYPQNTKFDTNGNASSDDWEEITLYNTDEGMYMKNVRISNTRIYNTDGEYLWTEEHTAERGMWPDTKNAKIDYEVVKIMNPEFDHTVWIDFDMNRSEE
ncbi:MAG: hypothetical protein A2Y17_13605 [Clostridiales bacterium GWF2_38_85]|nr:MAG: hypothetical protein A2Y17_13605 [Clostridiales bacterium GWF2_38_85]